MSAIPQKSFAGGELAPALYARTDIAKYAIGLRTLRNMLVMRHGGATNRPGTQYAYDTKFPSKTVRLIPFVFNSSQTYVLEFGDLYMRVYQNGSPVTYTAQNLTGSGISNDPVSILEYAGADTFNNGDEVFVSGVRGAIGQYVNNRIFVVANLNTAVNKFTLNDKNGNTFDATTWGAYVAAGPTASGGTVAKIYEIATPYLEADLQALQFSQSADVITIVHPSYAPRELSRTGNTSWSLTAITFGPTISAPTNVNSNTQVAALPIPGHPTVWGVTAISTATGEESLLGLMGGGSSPIPTSAAPSTITWIGPAGASSYRIYRSDKGDLGRELGFVGSTVGTKFIDSGFIPDYTDLCPDTSAVNPFPSADNYPSTVLYSKGRLFYGATNNNPDTIWASQIGFYRNFERTVTIQDDESIQFTLAGRSVAQVRHLIEAGNLLVLTSLSEFALLGNGSGVITPSEINPQQYSTIGSSQLAPLIVNGAIIFVQARQNQIRDIAFDFYTNVYKGNELTIFSSHLLEGFTVRDWAYQQIPQSIVWAVRSDGILLGLTYLREQELFAWHRHDFQDAVVEQACSVPEGTEDALYLVIKRSVNGSTVRYVERMNTRNFDEITDAIFMDSAMSYDGRNTGSRTMTLTGGTNWTYDETLLLIASSNYFLDSDVGDRIDLTGSDGSVIRCTIKATYASKAQVDVTPHETVPASLRNTATLVWTRCVDELNGLWHLEGKQVSVLGDGFVVGSPFNIPNNGSGGYPAITVTSGKVTLPAPYGIIHVGLPILADIETLDIDQAQGESLADKKKLITRVSTFVQNTRGIWVGPKPPTDDDVDALQNLVEIKVRNQETYDEPVSLATDVLTVPIRPEWNSNGRVFIRQVDPLPMTILSLIPTGLIPWQGGK